MSPQWAEDSRRNAKIITHRCQLKSGINHIFYGQVSPNLILERIVVYDTSREKKESYLGPVDSFTF